jgi:hypothetical protein
MEMLLAFAVGFAVGGQGGTQDRHQVTDSLGTIRNSEQVTTLVMVARARVGQTLREVANMVDGGGEVPPTPDLVDRVRQLVQH